MEIMLEFFNTERKTNCLKGVISEQVYDGSFTKVMVKVDKQLYKAIISGNDKLYKKGDIDIDAVVRSVVSMKGHLSHGHIYRLQKNIFNNFILRGKKGK